MKVKTEAVYDIKGRALLLSDLHLTPSSSDREQLLERFLDHHLDGTERLFVLGDLFEFWIGGKHAANGEFKRVIALLKRVVDSGVPVTILKGNRDFHMGSEIGRLTGASLINEAFELRSGGRRYYVCHGDTFCTRDRGYLRTRAILRNPIIMWIYRTLPERAAHFLADGFRQTSRRVGMNKQNGKTSIVLNAVERVFDAGYDGVICGHVHTPRRVELTRDDGTRSLLVLGDWSQKGWYAELLGDRLELNSFE